MIDGWEKTEVGERYSKVINRMIIQLFPKPFAVDSRYANINIFFEALKESEHFEIIGLASLLKQRMEITPLAEELIQHPALD